jgi:membrane fusion protein, multidrug efflux system
MTFFGNNSTHIAGRHLGCPTFAHLAKVDRSALHQASQRTRILLVVLAVLFGLTSCSDQRAEPSSAIIQPAAPNATDSTPPATITDATLSITGPLIVEHQVDITAQREGVIATISADAGDRVRSGAILAKLDDRQLVSNLEAARAKTRSIQADLKNWEAEAEVLKADYVRAQRLWNEKLIAEEQLQHAQYKVESDKWDILRVKEQLNTAKEEEHSLELELEKTRIMAPFNGLVARRYTREGQSVAKGDRLFWITAEGPLRVRFTLPEKFIGRLKRGQQLPLVSPEFPTEKHQAKVIAISPVVDPSSATIEGLAELIGPHGELRPGMSVTLRVPNAFTAGPK